MPAKPLHKELKVATLMSSGYINGISKAVISRLADCYESVTVKNFNPGYWYNSGRTFFANDLLIIPRPSGQTSTWWQTENIIQEFNDATPLIEKQVCEAIVDYRPDLLVIFDFPADLEYLVIQCFNKFDLAVVIFDHGPDSEFYASKIQQVSIIKKLFISLRSRIYNKHLPLRILMATSENILCLLTTCRYNLKKYLGLRINPAKVSLVGNPYFDELINKERVCQDSVCKKRILLLSSGGDFIGTRLNQITLEDFCLSLIRNLSEEVELHIRVKPICENSAENLVTKLRKDTRRSNIFLARNDAELWKSVNHFDIVISESSSFAIAELIIIDYPVVMLENRANPTKIKEIYLDCGVETLDLTRINENYEKYIKHQSKLASSQSRFESLRAHSDFFGPLDGLSGERAASKIIEALQLFNTVRDARQPLKDLNNSESRNRAMFLPRDTPLKRFGVQAGQCVRLIKLKLEKFLTKLKMLFMG